MSNEQPFHRASTIHETVNPLHHDSNVIFMATIELLTCCIREHLAIQVGSLAKFRDVNSEAGCIAWWHVTFFIMAYSWVKWLCFHLCNPNEYKSIYVPTISVYPGHITVLIFMGNKIQRKMTKENGTTNRP
jgi:hypothetical protein